MNEIPVWDARPRWLFTGFGSADELVGFDGGLTGYNPPQAFTPPTLPELDANPFLQPAFDFLRHYRARIEHKFARLKCIDQIDDWVAAVINLDQWAINRGLPYGPHWNPCPEAWWPFL